jgi:hypothetical protein
MISKRVIVVNIPSTLVLALLILSITSVNGEDTFTVDSYTTSTVTNAASSSTTLDDLIVFSIDYGVKQFAYLAFDLSQFPSGATPTSSVFKIESHAVSEVCYVSAFSSSGADWIGKNVTWETRPEIGTFVSANLIDTMKEWYSYDAESLNNAVKGALAGDGLLTISLKTGIGEPTQYGIIGFYPDAVLEIDYIIDDQNSSTSEDNGATYSPNEEVTSTSSSGSSELLTSIILILFLIAVIVVTLAFIIKRLR